MRKAGTTKYCTVPNETEQYNMVTRDNSIIPTYDLSKRETSISLYLNNKGDLIIVGNVVGSDYIFWMSFSKTSDVERNEEIFNHIANDEPERVSYLYKVLEYNEIPYSVLEDYYLVHMKRMHGGEQAWKTPFGHYYGKDQIEKNGSFFARDVAGFMNELHRRCEIRECDGRYEEILKGYVDFLQNQETYTSDVRKLEELLKTEEYLCISPQKTVQDIYRKCRRLCHDLYSLSVTKIG